MPVRTPLAAPAATVADAPSSLGEDGRAARLTRAAAQLISERGLADASARAIASVAGASPSAINYNFGGLERLFFSAFEQGIAQTAQWLEARGPEILALPRTADGAGRALDYLLSEWTGGARPLALLYQECLAATAGRGPAADWTRLWRDFWLRAASAFGLGEREGRLLHLFFESEALHHLSRWSPALERAALRDMCDHFAEVWLGAPRRSASNVLERVEQMAGVRPLDSFAPSALRIARCAAEVVEDGGLGGLTHRAVAARARVTTGAVTHHFRTVEDLLAGAIRGQVMIMTQADAETGDSPPPPVEEISTAQSLFEAMRFHALADRPPSPALRRRRLFLAAVRRPEMANAAAMIRFSYGATTRDALARLFPIPKSTLSLQAAVLSRLLASLWFACSADPSPDASRIALFEGIQAGFARGAVPG